MYRVVFVEDDPELGQLIADFLARHDMTVHIEPRGIPRFAASKNKNPIWFSWISCYPAWMA